MSRRKNELLGYTPPLPAKLCHYTRLFLAEILGASEYLTYLLNNGNVPTAAELFSLEAYLTKRALALSRLAQSRLSKDSNNPSNELPSPDEVEAMERDLDIFEQLFERAQALRAGLDAECYGVLQAEFLFD